MSITRVDLHVKVLDDTVVERAKAQGLDLIVYAPHFRRLPEVRQEAATYSDSELAVVPGREVFTGTWRNRRHILVVNPQTPIPDFITFEGAMEALETDSGAVLIPHPTFLSVSCSRDEIRSYRAMIDAVETYNPKHLTHHNERAARLAENLSIPVFASSYAHLKGTVGEVWTAFDGTISSGEGLLVALEDEMPRSVRRRNGPGHRMRCLGEFAHLGWENSWEKIDRVLLSGMEATHPDHVAYDGRFDDVAVY